MKSQELYKNATGIFAVIVMVFNITLQIIAFATDVKANFSIYATLTNILLLTGVCSSICALIFWTKKVIKSILIGVGIYIIYYLLIFALEINWSY